MKKIIIDSNVPFIAPGQIGEAWAIVILDEAIKQNIKGYTDVLYLQEILDRYFYINENYKGKRIYFSFKRIPVGIFSITVRDFDLSHKIYKENKGVYPRDAMHAAVALNNKVPDIFSVDGPSFDKIPGVRRVDLSNLLQELGLKKTYTYERKNISRS